VQFGHVDRVLQDECEIAIPVEQRRVRRAPISFVQAGAVGTGDCVVDEREMVDPLVVHDAPQRGLQQPVAVRLGIAWESVEHVAADEIGTIAHRYRQIGVVHRDDLERRIQQDVRVRRGIEQRREINGTQCRPSRMPASPCCVEPYTIRVLAGAITQDKQQLGRWQSRFRFSRCLVSEGAGGYSPQFLPI
jgi:hypothetical protein